MDARTTITISKRFQVTIPQAIRKPLGLEPGQKLQAILVDSRIVLVQVLKLEEMRGFLRGIDTTVKR